MKKRILHFYSVMNVGGAETFTMNVFRNIDRTKYIFDFACSSNKTGFFDEEIKQLGGNVYHFSTSKNPFIIISRIRKLLRDNGPYDCVHSTSMFFSSLICIAAKMEGINNIIIHSHSAGDSNKETLTRHIYIKMSRYIINKYASYKLSCGTEAAKYLFGTIENVQILRNGIDCQKFANVEYSKVKLMKEKLGIKDEVIVGEVARFSRVKNHEYYINLAKILDSHELNYKIVLVGDGEEKNNIMNLVKNNNLSKKFIFLPATNDVSVYMKLFDVFVMPSLYEGFPMTIIEALSAGTKCIISSNITDEFKIFGDFVKYFDLDGDFPIENIKKKNNDYTTSKDILKKIIDNDFDIKTTINYLEKIYNYTKGE